MLEHVDQDLGRVVLHLLLVALTLLTVLAALGPR
jgi:hypothetical protein